MLRNYFKTAWRNLWKNKVYSAINIVGLATGMAACILIMLFVFYEQSFDNFHKKNIYRLNEVQKFPGMVASQKVALSMFPMGPTMKKDFPQIRNFTRIRWDEKVQMGFQEKRIWLPWVYAVDSTFLQIFDFKLLEGNRETALQQPNSIVLTRSAATTIFGNQNPMGKIIHSYGGDTTLFRVTGIMDNIPKNSQLQFDALFSFNTIYKPDWMNNWGGNWLNTYFELAPNTDIAAFEKKFPAFLKKYMSGGGGDGWKYYELFLLPLKDVHDHSADIGLDYINYQKFDRNYTKVFSIIALIVLIIACINFMNLSTARSAERSREVGIRKSIGAQRFQLLGQFMGETILLSMIALAMALIMVQLALPYVRNLSQRELSLSLFSHPSVLFILLLGTLLVGLVSGLYPATYLSSFQPVKVLKGSPQTGKNKGTLRNILVVGQFASAIFLIIATIFVVRQLNFMRSQDPGYSKEQVMTLPLDNITYGKYGLLKEELLKNPNIVAVTASQDQLGSHLDQSGILFEGNGPWRELTSTRLIVDPDYLNLYKIALLTGKNFSKEKSANGKEYIINESLAKELLKDNPKMKIGDLLGRHFGFDSTGYIVGIARDFNFNSLHYKIETMFMFNQKEWGLSTVSVKLNGAKAKAAISHVEAIWKKLFPGHPFEFQFLEEHFAEMYRADAQVSKIVGILATLAILISCLGLFGLASYSAEKRIKEIGIRKVLGASVQSVVSLLSIHFMKLVLIANLIAWPLAWFSIHKWLNDFAYRINISWWVFGIAGIAAIAIALITVSFQAIKAAVANPVKSLRTE